jgi:polysaccharide pyruvyl transferase WcaK-like protein
MRVVVIGDVSWNGNYHLGDEAMTEVAIAELRRRGVQVTLVAGDPGISAPFYDVDAVPRFGYRTIYRREPKIRHLEAILAGARGEGEIPAEAVRAVDAVRAADAVVIAGGGNLNSSGMHHIFERLTLKRLAEHFGIPLYVSSQTVGPHLLPEDRELVGEIASYARAFGARERTTAALMREIVGDAGNVVHTLDDAILLEPSRSPEEARELLGLSERYVVGSFTYHAWSTGLSREEYYRKLAVMLDQIVAEQDVDVVLLPHMGKLGDTEDLGQDGDRFGHERIAAYTASGRRSACGGRSPTSAWSPSRSPTRRGRRSSAPERLRRFGTTARRSGRGFGRSASPSASISRVGGTGSLPIFAMGDRRCGRTCRRLRSSPGPTPGTRNCSR